MKVSKAAKRRAKRGFCSRTVTVIERGREDLECDPEMAAKIKRAREYVARTQDEFQARAQKAGKSVDWDNVGSVLAGPVR